MRRLLCALAFVAAAGLARADEPRTAPAVGTKLTYRLISVTKTPQKTVSVGQVYTYIPLSSDGTTAEGVIKPVAMIMPCDKGPGDLACEDSAKTPGAHYDGDMLTVPIADDSGAGLATHSYFKLVHFILVSRKFPIPASRDPKDYNLRDFGPDPAYMLINEQHCDLSGLEDFLPFGKSPSITLPCETMFTRSASRDGRLPEMIVKDTVSEEVSYLGRGWVTVPSGSWQVEKLTTTITPKDPSHPTSVNEILFSTQLGAIVRSHTVGRNPIAPSTTESTVELVSVGP